MEPAKSRSQFDLVEPLDAHRLFGSVGSIPVHPQPVNSYCEIRCSMLSNSNDIIARGPDAPSKLLELAAKRTVRKSSRSSD
jgi:hypothetical protein